ncbi:MAG: hypothetical protein V3T17_16420 [Pseudomonadales bacterium]
MMKKKVDRQAIMLVIAGVLLFGWGVFEVTERDSKRVLPEDHHIISQKISSINIDIENTRTIDRMSPLHQSWNSVKDQATIYGLTLDAVKRTPALLPKIYSGSAPSWQGKIKGDVKTSLMVMRRLQKTIPIQYHDFKLTETSIEVIFSVLGTTQ